MFRVSPWISYDPDGARPLDDTQHEPLPTVHNNSYEQNSEDEMDAPQISTLREEHSPPSTPVVRSEQPRHQSKFRVKLKLPSDPTVTAATSSPAGPSSTSFAGADLGAKSSSGPNPGPGSGSGSASASVTTGGTPRPTHTIKVPGGRADPSTPHLHTSSVRAATGADSEEDDDEDQDEEEEDQLADDDDVPSVATSSVTGSPQKNVSTTRSRGGAGARARAGRGRGRGRTSSLLVSTAEPPQTIFELSPSGLREGHTGTTTTDAGSGNGNIDIPTAPIKVPRKRTRKTDGEKEKKKQSRKPKAIKPSSQVQDDAASVTESFVGTQPSSPIMRDRDSPDMDAVPSATRGGTDARTAGESALGEGKAGASAESQAPFHLDANVPIPVYRLPSKPFLVQPPPKIPTGFAQTVPLDRSVAHVRHWRLAQRAIRGIAGGQWLTRTWIGDKESLYAVATGRAGGDASGDRNVTLQSVTGPGTKGSRGANGISASVGGGVAPSPLLRSPAHGPTLRLPPSSTLQSHHPPPHALSGKPPAGRSKLSTTTPLAAADSSGGSSSISSHEDSPLAPPAGSLLAEGEREGTSTPAPPTEQNSASILENLQPAKMRHSVSAQDSEVGADTGAIAVLEDVDVIMDTT